MIIDELSSIVSGFKGGQNSFFVRNLLKEHLQLYILNFIYSSPVYSRLIFTGGTCLRRFYGLPRLSEDLDFDFEKTDGFNPVFFSKEVEVYFKSQLQFAEIETKWSSGENILFLRFPILNKTGFSQDGQNNVLFVRCDFLLSSCEKFGLENRLLTAENFTFIARGYDLQTLFANKITAFLQRNFRKGSAQKESFKGRDVFDLSWFVGLSMKQNWTLKANWERVALLTGVESSEELVERLKAKLERIKSEDLAADLEPFIVDQNFVKSFSLNFKSFIVPYLNKIV